MEMFLVRFFTCSFDFDDLCPYNGDNHMWYILGTRIMAAYRVATV